jgi:tRNA splicing endonuclease
MTSIAFSTRNYGEARELKALRRSGVESLALSTSIGMRRSRDRRVLRTSISRLLFHLREFELMTKYLVIETFKQDSLEEAYARFRSRGRMMPSGLNYIDSWLERVGVGASS